MLETRHLLWLGIRTQTRFDVILIMLKCILSEVNAVDVRVEHFRLFVSEVNWLFRIPFEPFGLSRGTKETRSVGEDGSV